MYRIGIVSLVFFSCLSAHAWHGPDEGNVPESVQDTVVTPVEALPEVTVTENRHQQAQRSTAPQFVLDQHDMLRMGVTDIADALHRLPGITLRDYGGAGGMKTVSVRGFGAKHTGVSYDGVVLGEGQSGEIDLARYTLDNMAAMQLSVGDNEQLFVTARQASTPALLTIDTSTPAAHDADDGRKTRMAALLRVGSFGYVSPMLRVEQHFSPRFSLWAVGEYVYAENDYPFRLRNVSVTTTERRTNSRMNQGHGEVNMRWLMNDRSSLTGKLYYYDNDRQLPGQVFYYSNIGAQLQAGFNTGGGAWNNLESLVDRQWCADTLYQVIGCIFETFTDRYGTTVTKKTGTNGAGNSFQVPTAWYKVLLRTKNGNTGKRVDECTSEELQCVGVILTHRSNAGHKTSAQDLYPVSTIETLTGLEFFVNVPNAPKDSYTASDWGL